MSDESQRMRARNSDGAPVGELLEVVQHNPLNTDQLAMWAGGDVALVNGGPVVVLGGTRKAVDRLVGLGDYAVRDGDRFWAESADGFTQRFIPA